MWGERVINGKNPVLKIRAKAAENVLIRMVASFAGKIVIFIFNRELYKVDPF